MSQLLIIHETVYRYRRAVEFGPHRIILRPREGHDIHVEDMALEIEPGAALEWSLDVFGNSVATAVFSEAASELRIRNRVLLTQTLPFPARALHRGQPAIYPPEYSPIEAVVAASYQQSTYPDDLAGVQGWLEDLGIHNRGETAEGVVALLNRKVHESVGYTRRESRGVQTPAETLAYRTGSCRDLSVLMLEALRMLGFPARFASGYLDCAASEAGRASTHAWAEAYLPHTGWVGYDPTIGAATSAKHVVVGVSNHPRGVMPISGSFFGKAEEYLGMEVIVQTSRPQG